MLDDLYYVETPKYTNTANVEIPAEACENFRAGDISSKALKGVDVNGIFASVCVHGFVYRMIGIFCFLTFSSLYYYFVDVAKGESLDYAAEIAKTFNNEFPKAKLTISYDIACKLKNIFAVICFLITSDLI